MCFVITSRRGGGNFAIKIACYALSHAYKQDVNEKCIFFSSPHTGINTKCFTFNTPVVDTISSLTADPPASFTAAQSLHTLFSK